MVSSKEYVMPVHESIVCLGDSITAGYWDEEGLGWVSRLSLKVAEKAPLKYAVLGAGIKNNTTKDAWHDLISHVAHINPQYIVMMIGTNDLIIDEGGETEGHRVPFIDRSYNYLRLFEYFKTHNIKPLIVGPIPVETDIVRFKPHDDLVPVYTGMRHEQKCLLKLNDWLQETCKEHDLPFLRVFEDWLDAIEKDTEGLYIDGLHPNAKGHQMLADQVFDALCALKYVE